MLFRYGAVLFALFTSALGYGTLVPLVPVYLAAGGGGDVAWHSGALPAAFLISASVSAPLWGHLSDRVGRRIVLMCGSGGAVLAVVPFFLEHGLARLYGFQVLAGLAFGAVAPAALALLYEAGDPRSTARRVAWSGAATLGGYLTGPALGGWFAGLAEGSAALLPHQVLRLALGAQALAAAAAVVAVYLSALVSGASTAGPPVQKIEIAQPGEALAALLAVVLASVMVGVFEIGTALHLRGPLGLGSREVAALFVACSGSMAIAQLVFLPRLPDRLSRIHMALAIIAFSGVALAAMAFAGSYAATLLLGALIGGGLGLVFGVLGLQMAAAAGPRRGLVLGAQNAAANAGQAAGSMLGGMVFAAFGENALPGLGVAMILLTLLLAVGKSRLQPA